MFGQLEKYFPILNWGRKYRGETFVNDMVAAVIVTIMLIPPAIGGRSCSNPIADDRGGGWQDRGNRHSAIYRSSADPCLPVWNYSSGNGFSPDGFSSQLSEPSGCFGLYHSVGHHHRRIADETHIGD